MQINFFNEDSSTARIPRAVIYKTLKRAQKLFRRKIRNKIIGVVFVSSSESKRLNKKYRGKNRATNVLSFESRERDELGDIVICPTIAKKEAQNLGEGFNSYIDYLFVHGLLHLLGYDHKNKRQENKMEEISRKILM